MQDTDRLLLAMRHALHLQRPHAAALGALVALAGCADSSSSDRSAAHAAGGAKSEAHAAKTPAPTPAPAQATPDPDAARFAPIPGDPPYVDGFNPEELTCPSGNWCGPKAAVLPLSAGTGPEVMGCPKSLAGHAFFRKENKVDPKDPVYRGMSTDGALMAAFNEGRTKSRRAEGQEDVCCYHWFEYCSGRPLLDPSGRAHTAPPAPGADEGWAPLLPAPPTLPSELAARLGRAWLADGLAEHASVAAFARASLELLALGAPADLVADCQRAGLDEVDHARRCFALARRHGVDAAPGPLPPPPLRPADPVALALATFDEGCLGETVAALVAERSAAACQDPVARATLEILARDEAAHAALAFRTLAWLARLDPARVSAALAAHARRRAADILRRPEADEDGEPDLAAHGRIGPAARQQAARDAWARIVAPMLSDLLPAA